MQEDIYFTPATRILSPRYSVFIRIAPYWISKEASGSEQHITSKLLKANDNFSQLFTSLKRKMINGHPKVKIMCKDMCW